MSTDYHVSLHVRLPGRHHPADVLGEILRSDKDTTAEIVAADVTCDAGMPLDVEAE